MKAVESCAVFMIVKGHKYKNKSTCAFLKAHELKTRKLVKREARRPLLLHSYPLYIQSSRKFYKNIIIKRTVLMTVLCILLRIYE
jgi:hypothetical protein